jgi:Holliday junction resolvasome RuvABC endonuclease subunit
MAGDHQVSAGSTLSEGPRAHGMASISSATNAVAGNRFADRPRKAAPTGAVDADAEGLQQMPDRVLEIQELPLQVAPVRQQQPQPVASFRS